MGIRELSESLDLDFLNNHFITDTGNPKKPLIHKVDDGETAYTCRALNFPVLLLVP